MRRKIVILYTLLVFVASFVGTFLVLQRMPTHTLAASTDWTMYQGDLGRSGFNSAETILNRSTAPRLMVHWKYHAGGAINTQPVVVNGRIYWGAWDGNEYAMDLNGNVLWKTYLGQTIGCKNQATGVASTATIASVSIKGIPTAVDFVGGGNGRFYALDAVHGTILWSTPLGASPHLMIWDAPAVYNGSVYIGVSSYGDCPLVQGQLIQLDASTGQVQHTFNVVPNGCIGGGIWAAPTVDTAAQTLYFTTGTRGIGCPTYETLSLALLEVRATDLTLVGSWQVPASQQISDGDFGSTPTLFKATIAGVVHQLVGAVNKNGIYYAFDRSNISRGPLWQHQIATGSFRISPSGWDGATLYAANATTTIAGHGCAGSVRALNPATGASVWESCVPGGVLGAVTLVPGLVIVGAGSSLVVLDTTTGQRLFLYTDPTIGSDFWGAASVSNGMLYMGNKDGNLYAFGVSGTPAPPPPAPSSTPATGKAPVSKTWYFAEGKVGQGFTEFLTIENPGAVSCAVTIQYLLGSGGPVTVPVTVPPFSRYTERPIAQGWWLNDRCTLPTLRASVVAPMCWEPPIPAATTTLPMCPACRATTPTSPF